MWCLDTEEKRRKPADPDDNDSDTGIGTTLHLDTMSSETMAPSQDDNDSDHQLSSNLCNYKSDIMVGNDDSNVLVRVNNLSKFQLLP